MSSASNILCHLRPCAVEVDFDGSVYTVKAMDAIEWIVLLDDPDLDLYGIFPGCAGVSALERVEDALWEGRATHDDVGRLALGVVGTAADRPWWLALRIIRTAASAWESVHVNRAAGMSLAGWLDEVWTKMLERVDPKKRPSWVQEMEKVPKGWEVEIDFDEEEAAFLAAMNAVMR